MSVSVFCLHSTPNSHFRIIGPLSKNTRLPPRVAWRVALQLGSHKNSRYSERLKIIFIFIFVFLMQVEGMTFATASMVCVHVRVRARTRCTLESIARSIRAMCVLDTFLRCSHSPFLYFLNHSLSQHISHPFCLG